MSPCMISRWVRFDSGKETSRLHSGFFQFGRGQHATAVCIPLSFSSLRVAVGLLLPGFGPGERGPHGVDCPCCAARMSRLRSVLRW